MSEEIKPKHEWWKTQLDKRDQPSDLDWSGFDQGEFIGRIRKETDGPTKDQWLWAGTLPPRFRGTPPVPNQGYRKTAREAALMVEDYWSLCVKVKGERKS